MNAREGSPLEANRTRKTDDGWTSESKPTYCESSDGLRSRNVELPWAGDGGDFVDPGLLFLLENCTSTDSPQNPRSPRRGKENTQKNGKSEKKRIWRAERPTDQF